jgi:signal transduction histidine kinase
MTDAEQAKAFDQFFRGEQARRMVPDGSGIGLYAARGLIEAMGGQLTVESSPAAGTTFRVQVPAEAIRPEDDPSRS